MKIKGRPVLACLHQYAASACLGSAVHLRKFCMCFCNVKSPADWEIGPPVYNTSSRFWQISLNRGPWYLTRFSSRAGTPTMAWTFVSCMSWRRISAEVILPTGPRSVIESENREGMEKADPPRWKFGTPTYVTFPASSAALALLRPLMSGIR